MLVEHIGPALSLMSREGGRGNGGGGLVGWVVTKVSKGSNYFLIHYLLP